MEEYENIPDDELRDIILPNFTTEELLQLIRTSKSQKIVAICRELLGKNPTNEELLMAIAADPEHISDYEAMWDEKEFPFYIELFRSRVVPFAVIRQYLGESNYIFEDLIYSLYEYMNRDPSLPQYFDMVLDIYGRDTLPPEQLEVLLSKNNLTSNMLKWLQGQQEESANYAAKPGHVVLMSAEQFQNLPVLRIQLPASVQEIKEEVGEQVYNVLTSVPASVQRQVLGAVSVNGDEVLKSQVLDWWFGPICPDINPKILSIDDVDDPMYKYGGKRMLLDTSYEYDEFVDEYKSEWFTGSCQQCHLKIAHEHYSIRKPRYKGGWSGCYCSWKCLEDEMEALLYQLDEVENGLQLGEDEGKEKVMLADEAEFARTLEEYNAEVQLITYFKGIVTIADRDEDGKPGASINPSSYEGEEEEGVAPRVNTSSLRGLMEMARNLQLGQAGGAATATSSTSSTSTSSTSTSTSITESSGQWPFISLNTNKIQYQQE